MSILRRLWSPLFGRPWKPLEFPKNGFLPITLDSTVDEESLPDYVPSHFYPIRIEETFRDRYQIVGKLGFGRTSTVWLAWDLTARKHVAVKVYIRSNLLGSQMASELDVYKRIRNAPGWHPGRSAVRTLLDHFKIEVAFILKRLFQALDLLHNECRLAHTDVKESNILIGCDKNVFAQFEQGELTGPSPRKELPERSIYLTRPLNLPSNFGGPILCDFGSAIALDDGAEHRECIQPKIYRAPEVILGIPWTYSVDIWNAGCLAWGMLEGESLFSGHDPEAETYRGRAHLAEMIALLGHPPEAFLARSQFRSEFYSESGQWIAGIPIPESKPMGERESVLAFGEDFEDREAFLRLIDKMLQWEPEKRCTARELVEDEWIVKHT